MDEMDLDADNFETSDDEVQLLERESDDEGDVSSSEDDVEAVSEVPEVVRPLEQRKVQRRTASGGVGGNGGGKRFEPFDLHYSSMQSFWKASKILHFEAPSKI